MGTLKGFEVELTVDIGCKSKFFKVRTVSYALNKRIEKENREISRRQHL